MLRRLPNWAIASCSTSECIHFIGRKTKHKHDDAFLFIDFQLSYRTQGSTDN